MDSEQNGEPFDIDSGIDTRSAGEGGTDPAPQATSAQSSAPGVAVDLARWGRGEIEYVFDEVKLAIDNWVLGEIYKIVDARFVSLKSRADAVRFLVDEGFISSAEARTDV